MTRSLYSARAYPTTAPPTSKDEDEVGLRVDGDFAADPALSADPSVPPGRVLLAIVSDSAIPARILVPADSPAAAAALTRRSTRVLALGPDAALPAPRLDKDAPSASLLPAYQGVA